MRSPDNSDPLENADLSRKDQQQKMRERARVWLRGKVFALGSIRSIQTKTKKLRERTNISQSVWPRIYRDSGQWTAQRSQRHLPCISQPTC